MSRNRVPGLYGFVRVKIIARARDFWTFCPEDEVLLLCFLSELYVNSRTFVAKLSFELISAFILSFDQSAWLNQLQNQLQNNQNAEASMFCCFW